MVSTERVDVLSEVVSILKLKFKLCLKVTLCVIQNIFRYSVNDRVRFRLHLHPEETSKNSDICDTIKSLWFSVPIYLNERNIFAVVCKNLRNV